MIGNRLALLAAGAASVLGAILLASGCSGGTETVETPQAFAPPQSATLDWAEHYPAGGKGLTFTVRSFTVTDEGWRAEVGIENASDVAWSIEVPESARSGQIAARSLFGLGVFPTGELADLEQASDEQRLPPVRPAETFAPALPAVLGSGASWTGTMSANGRLPAGLWVRIAFGPIWALDTPPEGMQGVVSWYTDHAVELRG